jgi:hypothetical protein
MEKAAALYTGAQNAIGPVHSHGSKDNWLKKNESNILGRCFITIIRLFYHYYQAVLSLLSGCFITIIKLFYYYYQAFIYFIYLYQGALFDSFRLHRIKITMTLAIWSGRN